MTNGLSMSADQLSPADQVRVTESDVRNTR